MAFPWKVYNLTALWDTILTIVTELDRYFQKIPLFVPRTRIGSCMAYSEEGGGAGRRSIEHMSDVSEKEKE